MEADEEKWNQPLPEEELMQYPKFVPENNRFACSDLECGYITIDAVMLVYHMQALHPGKLLKFLYTI